MLLLDTCTVLWLADDPKRFSSKARGLLASYPDALYVSTVSAWEIAWKHQRGKLTLPVPPSQWLDLAFQNHGLRELPLTRAVAVAAAHLPDHHRDPCDRFLVAAAHVEGLRLVTPDPQIHRYVEASAVW